MQDFLWLYYKKDRQNNLCLQSLTLSEISEKVKQLKILKTTENIKWTLNQCCYNINTLCNIYTCRLLQKRTLNQFLCWKVEYVKKLILYEKDSKSREIHIVIWSMADETILKLLKLVLNSDVVKLQSVHAPLHHLFLMTWNLIPNRKYISR